MTGKTLQIALRIALLREEFTETEILSAVELLEDKGTSSALLDYLAGRKRESKNSRSVPSKNKPIDEQRSKAVLELENKDPEKYQLLSEFDLLLRKGSVLPEIEEINKLGKKLSKDFAPRKSRREMVSKFMTLLATRSVDEIREIIQASLASTSVDDKDSDYQRLAQFIITGKTTKANM